jgi:chorismate lyase / 3-hydroxybenzoate synthase
MPPTHSSSALAAFNPASCSVVFGVSESGLVARDASTALGLALPVLLGSPTECILEGTAAPVEADSCTTFSSEGCLAGFAIADANGELELSARDLYQRVFAASHGLHLYRIWNYVPRINAIEHGLENYRRFCRGRSLAFEGHFGRAFQPHLPAASAVGVATGPHALAFHPRKAAPQHCENPRQVPAFEYPAAYGPRPPSFSRATLVDQDGGREIFISGTAAIRGHATVAPADLAGQLVCTRDNLNIIAARAGAGEAFGALAGWQRSLKVYVRRDTDLLHVRNDLERHLLRIEDSVTYLQADLCRSDLLVEIEAVLTEA